ncbi:hypothetical protein MXD63_40305, partial [Frankia sp. Cpl3]|nr:hypothetical protein [Frankia sp. Cpl3]
MGKATVRREERSGDQLNLFAIGETAETALIRDPASYPEVPPFSQTQQLKEERDLLGVYLSGHPLDQYGYVMERPEV